MVSCLKLTGNGIEGKAISLRQYLCRHLVQRKCKCPPSTGYVGVARLELATAWSQTRNANQLRYTPYFSRCEFNNLSGRTFN